MRATEPEGPGQRGGAGRHVGVGHVEHLLDVGAGGEHLLAAVDDDGPDRGIVGGFGGGLLDLVLTCTFNAFIGGRSSRMVPMPSAFSSRTSSPTAVSLLVELRSPAAYARVAVWPHNGFQDTSIEVSMGRLFHEEGLQITDDWIRTRTGSYAIGAVREAWVTRRQVTRAAACSRPDWVPAWSWCSSAAPA
jgi:hypothetical protein